MISGCNPLHSKPPFNPTLDPDLILLAEGQAARVMGKSVSTLQKERVSGAGVPYVKLGRAVRYRLSDLKAHIARNIRRSTSDRSGEDA